MDKIEDIIRAYNRQQIEINKLRGIIKRQQETIDQLRNTLASLDVTDVVQVQTKDYTVPQRGRPKKIDNETLSRVKLLRQDGLSIRAIAQKEGISIGTVSNILQSKN